MKRNIILLLCAAAFAGAWACTSMIADGRATASGRPLLWKHRDTGADNNFLARVEPTDSTIGYVGLFNGGDSTLSEAWMGMNDAGFAIMNTASYNLAPDTAALKDREGAVMTLALRGCRSVDDFAALLDRLPRPMGVQANFGVIDSRGGAAYFETSDHAYVRYDASASPSGALIRTNHSLSGTPGEGSGYIRYATADSLSRAAVAAGSVAPALLTDTLSRSFYHSLTGHDYLSEGERYVANRDFIPRDISTASIVIEGVVPGEDPANIHMWAALGYPPCAVVRHVTLTDIPRGFGPELPGWRSPACAASTEAFRTAIPFAGGSGPGYLDLDVLRPLVESARSESLENYRKYENKSNK